MRAKHHVYVVELSKDVLYEAKFVKSNPGYVTGKPCVYVGMTGLDPDVRFDKHKSGIRANKYVTRYGLRLMISREQCSTGDRECRCVIARPIRCQCDPGPQSSEITRIERSGVFHIVVRGKRDKCSSAVERSLKCYI